MKAETLDGFEKMGSILSAALALKAEDPTLLDMRELSSFADVFVILSGRSNRHVRALAEAIIETLGKANEPPLGVEGLGDGHWVLIDANDIIVHVFEPSTRERFDLERLWSDAPRIDAGEFASETASDAVTHPSSG